MSLGRLILAGAVTAAASSAAFAAGSASFTITGTVPATCAFTTTPPSVVTIGVTAGIYSIGDLGYTCNFIGNANLVLNLPNGTVLNNPTNGGDNVVYDVFWGVPPNNPASPVWQNWPSAASIPFAWPTAPAANTETKGPFKVRLNSNLGVAGTYTSTVSYTISP
jgi:hypothetical protein